MKNDERRPLWCYSVSAKRYALYNLDDAGQPLLRKWSEHGLGHLLNPVDPDSDDRDWIRQVWEMIIRDALGLDAERPAWLDRPALTRIAASSPELLRPFAAYNANRPFADQVKPFGFLLSTRPAPFGAPAGIDPQHFHLIAPYETDARRWQRMKWFDLYSGREFRITTRSTETASATVARVRTYADVIAAYRVHRESKSLAPDGAPCDANTAGLLRRRAVRVQRDLIRFIGKESNRLEDIEAGFVHDIDDVLTEYMDSRRDAWERLILPVLRDVPRTALMRATGMSASEIRRVLNQRVRPRRRRRAQLSGEAVALAREWFAACNVAAPRDDHAGLVAYLEARASRAPRACALCGEPIVGRSPRARYCSDSCKRKAADSR